METVKTTYTDNVLTHLDGLEIRYKFTPTQKDFEHLTYRVAREIRLPFEFAICKQDKNTSAISIYGRYGKHWQQLAFHSDFIVGHLLNKLLGS